jgi:hypothetical protein
MLKYTDIASCQAWLRKTIIQQPPASITLLVFRYLSDKTSVVPTTQHGLTVTLNYNGTDVDGSTMPVDDVVAALQGFASAYSKLASGREPGLEHQIRVSAVDHSSFAVSVVPVVNWAIQNPKEALLMAAPAVGAAKWVVDTIIKVIELRKATEGKAPDLKVDGNGNTVISNSGSGTVIMIPADMQHAVRSRLIDQDIAKIARPLEKGKVDTAKITATDDSGRVLADAVITSEEKRFFYSEQPVVATSRPAKLDGYLISLNKESKRGTFRLSNGEGIPYHFVGPDTSSLYNAFSHKGTVRVECEAEFDESLQPIRLAIANVILLQHPLF